MGFATELKLAPFFFDRTVTGESYHNMLTTQVIPQLRLSGKLNDIIFQQDGAPPHFSGKVTELLKFVLVRIVLSLVDFLRSGLPDLQIFPRWTFTYGVH